MTQTSLVERGGCCFHCALGVTPQKLLWWATITLLAHSTTKCYLKNLVPSTEFFFGKCIFFEMKMKTGSR